MIRLHKDKERGHDESGTVLLTTLLMTSIIAVVAVGILSDLKLSIKRTINVNSYAQADWYAKGVEDFAHLYLEQSFLGLSPEEKNLALLDAQPIILPAEGGVMTLRVSDGGHCFALNSLVNQQGIGDESTRQQFIHLLNIIAFGKIDANRVSNTIIDWIDRDSQTRPGGAEDGGYLGVVPPYRTANTALSSAQEIRAVQGMSEELYQTLRPFICTGAAGQMTKFNINSARGEHSAVLASLLGGPTQIETAVRLITERPQGGYKEETLKNTIVPEGNWPEGSYPDQIIYEPELIWIEAEIIHGTAKRSRSFEFNLGGVDNTLFHLTYRGWGRESFRPRLKRAEQSPDESEN